MVEEGPQKPARRLRGHCALQSDSTWLGLVAHLYIITLAAFLLRGLLLLPLFLWLLPASTSRFRFEEESTQTGRN